MLPFTLPPLSAGAATPVWNGDTFVIGSHQAPLLEYSENFPGWSDDLTSLHEESAGDSHPIDLASRHYAIAQIKKFVTHPDFTALEIGCSSGFLLRDMKRSFPQATIIGADVVRAPLYRLAETLPNVPLMRFDLLQCPLPPGSIDVLVMLNVLEHIEDDRAALRNAFRLLKPGGILVMEVPAGPWLYDSYDKELQHFRRYSARELMSKTKQAGFRVVKNSHLGFLLFPLFAMVKLKNKATMNANSQSVVKKQAAASSKSGLLKLLMTLEERFLFDVPLPFGVRVLAVAQKPETAK